MTITVSLTNTRHIAAANAAYVLTIPPEPEEGQEPTPAPYADVYAYVQAAIERVADSWAVTTKVDVISVADFILRFTGAEYSAITSSVDPNIVGILATLRARADVRLGSPDAINGIAYLIGAGLLTQERGAEVLTY